MALNIEAFLNLMLPAGRYLERCAVEPFIQPSIFPDVTPPPEPAEIFKVYDKKRNPFHYVTGEDLTKWKLWGVLRKDFDLAYKNQVNRYYISRRKILSLRKNNPIKRTYKRLRTNRYDPSK